jgi:hypothetical protein
MFSGSALIRRHLGRAASGLRAVYRRYSHERRKVILPLKITKNSTFLSSLFYFNDNYLKFASTSDVFLTVSERETVFLW